MGMSEREYHIKVLENLLSHYKAREQCEGYYDSTLKDNVEALEYAISSLKTDEAYQLMYEGGEIFTKADMVAMLEDLDLKIDEMYEPQFSKEGMDGFYWAEGLFKDLVQEEINVLKGEEDGCNN